MVRAALERWLLAHWYGRAPIISLIPCSWLFTTLSGLRRRLYRWGLLHSVRLPAPVVVVGNISVGGSGKTPFVIWLAEALHARGWRPGIVTRGYGGVHGVEPACVTPDSDPMQAGDEAVLLARRTRVPVMAHPDRACAARKLLGDFDVNVILSDDGLQHYRLARDCEVILLDGARGLGNGWRLPAGPLREAASRLRSADLIVVKQTAGRAVIAAPEGAVRMRLMLREAVSLSDGRRVPLMHFAGIRVHALAGIADPQQFFDALAAQGLQVQGRPLPDHARLTAADLTFDDERPVLMTEKDAVKCRNMALPHHWYVSATADFAPDAESIVLQTIEPRLQAGRHQSEENHGHETA